MKYKLTQLKNISQQTWCFVSRDVLGMGGAIAAHQAGVLNLPDHVEFREKRLWDCRWDEDWCIAEDGE